MATKKVVDLLPGDVLPLSATRTVASFRRDATTVTVGFTNGDTETWNLDGDPAVEVLSG